MSVQGETYKDRIAAAFTLLQQFIITSSNEVLEVVIPSVCLYVLVLPHTRISQNVIDGFEPNFVEW